MRYAAIPSYQRDERTAYDPNCPRERPRHRSDRDFDYPGDRDDPYSRSRMHSGVRVTTASFSPLKAIGTVGYVGGEVVGGVLGAVGGFIGSIFKGIGDGFRWAFNEVTSGAHNPQFQSRPMIVAANDDYRRPVAHPTRDVSAFPDYTTIGVRG
jgi:hypothetical protein